MAQASKAIRPRDPGDPFGQRIGIFVGGPLSWVLRASAFVTKCMFVGEWLQYSIVAMSYEFVADQ